MERVGGGDFQESRAAKVIKSHDKLGVRSEVNPDRISELEEPLLIRILSFLNVKDAVRTGVLSKRWENLWTHVDSLVFTYDLDFPSAEQQEQFISSVDRALMQCTCPNIKKFSLLGFTEDFDHPEVVDKWLQWAFKKNVQFLKLDVQVFGFSAPEWFKKNLSIVKLQINDSGTSHLRRTVKWTSLKSLYLSRVVIDEKKIAIILKGSPVLESLTLIEVSGFKQLRIVYHPSLRKLVVFQGHECHELLDINAPWLQELEISGNFYDVIPDLINVSSLVNAKLTFRPFLLEFNVDDLLSDVTSKILASLLHVKKLTLGSIFIEALSRLKLFGRISPLFKFECKHLTIHLPIYKYHLPGIACFLENSPKLETMFIKVESPSKHHFSKYLHEICDINGNKYLSLHMVDFQQLKNVEVSHCWTLCSQLKVPSSDKECFDFELVEHILRNARVLEKLVISSSKRYKCSKCSQNCGLQYVSQLSHKLLATCLDGNDAKECELREKQLSFEFIFRN